MRPSRFVPFAAALGSVGIASAFCVHSTLRKQSAQLHWHEINPQTRPGSFLLSTASGAEGYIDNDDLGPPQSEAPDPEASAQTLNALVPRTTISKLSRRSDRQGFLQLLFHTSALIIAACIPQHHISLWATAYVSSFFFHGFHETVHGTAFATPQWNRVVRHVFGFLCFRPARHYFYYHWQHHKHTGNPELDSELQKGSFLDFPIDNLPTYIVYLSGIPFWIDATTSLIRHALGICPENYLQVSSKAASEVTKEARIYLALYACVGVSMALHPYLASFLARFWILPALLGQPFLRFYLLAEHRGMTDTDKNILANTRTVATPNWLTKRLAWCMPYHKEHHAWPSVPFWQLQHLHDQYLGTRAIRMGDLLYPAEIECQGYIDFNRVFVANLMNK